MENGTRDDFVRRLNYTDGLERWRVSDDNKEMGVIWGVRAKLKKETNRPKQKREQRTNDVRRKKTKDNMMVMRMMNNEKKK